MAKGRRRGMQRQEESRLDVVELFAGVGGFRLGLEGAGGFRVVWSNQWEPGTTKQHASDCYRQHFGADGHVCEDIAKVLDRPEEYVIPSHDLLVGGFPCQDYSVAKPQNQAEGIRGRKGVLWWEIHRLLERKQPRFLLLENVDRLLKSPVNQRGRDFAIILACLAKLGYAVEWRVINAADYGFPQRRRRVFIFGELLNESRPWQPLPRIYGDGVLSRAFPVVDDDTWSALGSLPVPADIKLDGNLASADDVYGVSENFGRGDKVSCFKQAGVMINGWVWTRKVQPLPQVQRVRLGDVVSKTGFVEAKYLIPESQYPRWEYLKGSKSEARIHKGSGTVYRYAEGGMAFPDPLELPSRTILTAEGGVSPSRFKHVVTTPDGRYRRLTPEELEELNGFPRGWTATGMSDVRRAFMMGNALVVGVAERIGASIREEVKMNSESTHGTEQVRTTA